MTFRCFAIATTMLTIVALAQPTWSATTLDHSAIISSSSGLGPADYQLAAYGQTFTAGSDNVLTDFTFYNGISRAGATLQLTVADWTGAAPGSVLFTSSVVPTVLYPDYHPQAFSFATGNLQLLSGHQYVAYLKNVSGLGETATYLSHVPSLAQFGLPAGSGYDGGYYVNLLNSNPTWRLYNQSGDDLQSSFKANFIASVPEPSSVAIFAIAFACLFIRVVTIRKRGASLSS